MTEVAFRDGKVVLRDGKVGSDGTCCCGCCEKTDGTTVHHVTKARCEDCTTCPDVRVPIILSACRGSGGQAHGVTTGEGCPGPITSVVVDSGGSGYAIPGRAAPELTIAGTGTGATFTPSFTETNGLCGDDTWAIASVAVSGGTGYTGGETLSITPQTGSMVTEAATLVLRTAAPTVTASASGGSGAVLAVSLTASAGHPAGEAPYVVQSVSVTDGGTGYTDGAAVTFAASGARLATSAAATIHTGTDAGRVNPELTPYVWGFDGTTAGTGAVLSATMSYVADSDAWEVASVSIIDGGSGYQVDEYLWYSQLGSGGGTVFDNPPYYAPVLDDWHITAVDENGAITALDAPGGFGLYYKNATVNNGRIASVTVTSGGQYDSGVPSSVSVAAGGKGYKDDPSATPYVASVTASVGGAGTGAVLTVHVDGEPGPTFGKITSITVGNGGTGYSESGICGKWKDPCPCRDCATFSSGCCRYAKVSISGSHEGNADGEWFSTLPLTDAGYGFSSAICGPYGPHGEYGWFVTKDVCDSLWPIGSPSYGGYWEGFIPLVEYKSGKWCCAKLGPVTMTCIGHGDPTPDGNCHGMTLKAEVFPGVQSRDFVTVPGIPFPVQPCDVDHYCTDYPKQCPS